MLFGVILSMICCGLIGFGIYFFTKMALGKKPESLDKIMYMIAPYGLAICMYYYIFHLREVDIAAAFVGFGTMNVILDIITNVILPAALLSILFVSFQMIQNIGWRFFVITILSFFLLAWLDITYKALDFSRNFGAAIRTDFPIVQWSASVFIALLVIAVSEHRRKGEKVVEAEVEAAPGETTEETAKEAKFPE